MIYQKACLNFLSNFEIFISEICKSKRKWQLSLLDKSFIVLLFGKLLYMLLSIKVIHEMTWLDIRSHADTTLMANKRMDFIELLVLFELLLLPVVDVHLLYLTCDGISDSYQGLVLHFCLVKAFERWDALGTSIRFGCACNRVSSVVICWSCFFIYKQTISLFDLFSIFSFFSLNFRLFFMSYWWHKFILSF